jgi:Trypsin-like peptidase domain
MPQDTARGRGAPGLDAVSHANARRSRYGSFAVADAASRGTMHRPGRLVLDRAQGHRRSMVHLVAACSISLFVLFPPASRATGACVDREALAHAAVSITRYFESNDRRGDPDLLGIRGTAWFLSPTSMVTVEHVATAMELSAEVWKSLDIVDGDIKQTIDVRIQRVAGLHSEKIALLELRTAFSGARELRVRMGPVAREEHVASLAYSGNRIRFVGGRFVQYGDGDQFAGTALLEMYDGNDRLVLDHGASGAPVLDCDGSVVAVVSNIFTQTVQFPSRTIRVSTAWGSPNVVSVPIHVLWGASLAH